MFPPLPSTPNLILMEEDVLRFWRRERIFDKVSAQREGQPEFVFYEDPPTANAVPDVNDVLRRACQDVFLRYQTMRGFYVNRRGGWDTHGLPVENEIEKRLGINARSQIEAVGVARFNQLCRKSAFDYIQDWERLTDRIGYWVDLESAYVSYTNDSIESVWWILKNLWDKGLLYQAEKVVPYCPRCGTPLSNLEVAKGYTETEVSSVYLRLPLVDEPGVSLLVWTTDSWTLLGNVAVAAHPEIEYVKVERPLAEGGMEQLILAGSLLEAAFPGEQLKVLERFKGRRLKGRRYRPLFTFQLPEKPAYFVVMEEFVTTKEGTGLVHLAPAFGTEDLQAALNHDLPLLKTVGTDGAFLPEVRPFSGRFVKAAEPHINQDLEARGLLLRSERAMHHTPFCPHCNTPLISYARPTWFLGTNRVKEKMAELSRTINWMPEHLRDGRFEKWLENSGDWVIGRERYWGTPLPVWECENCHHRLCIGLVSELEQLTGRDLSTFDLHRPTIDEVCFKCPECGTLTGESMRRVQHVVDAWFDAGAMLVTQRRFSYVNARVYNEQLPADLVCETADQTRGWFYPLHAISTMLYGKPAFRNAISLGLVLDKSGQKITKSRGNWIDPWEIINKYGADALRWCLYTAAPPGVERRLTADLLERSVRQTVRGFSLTLWNVLAFFVNYANLTGWKLAHSPEETSAKTHALDRWLLSELHALIQQVTNALESRDISGVIPLIEAFVNDLSGWYLRCSRGRFKELAPEEERQAAFAALYETLISLSKLVAPMLPLLAEEIYQHLVSEVDRNAPQSVHLAGWPEAEVSKIDLALRTEMQLVRKLASLGRAARNQAGTPVKQPLEEVAFSLPNREEARLLEKYASLLVEELNVRQVRLIDSAREAVKYTLKPLPGQLGVKYKNLFPQLSAAILALDTEGTARALLAGHNLLVAVDGKPYTILPEEVEVCAQALSGYATATKGPYLAAIQLAVIRANLTPGLEEEALLRQIVHHLQRLRKKAGIRMNDRVQVYLHASPSLQMVVDAHRAEILERVRAVGLEEMRSETMPEAHRIFFEIGGEPVTAAIAVVPA